MAACTDEVHKLYNDETRIKVETSVASIAVPRSLAFRHSPLGGIDR